MKNSFFVFIITIFLSSIDEYGFVVSATTKKQGYIRLYSYILNLIISNIPLYSETKAKYSHNKKNTSRYVDKSLKKSIPYRISVISVVVSVVGAGFGKHVRVPRTRAQGASHPEQAHIHTAQGQEGECFVIPSRLHDVLVVFIRNTRGVYSLRTSGTHHVNGLRGRDLQSRPVAHPKT